MYAQLGSIVFKGLYNFTDFSFAGDEANFAQFDLINNKAALQFTGLSLTEISANITMNVEFCNITQQLQALRASKDKAEVLPLLMGNGSYVGDFVIVSIPYSIDEAFADGTYKQISMQLSLKEYVSIDKLEQKRLSAVKNSLATGNKKTSTPVSVLQKPTPQKDIASSVTATKQQSRSVSVGINEMLNAPNTITADRILKAAKNGISDAADLIEKLDKNIENTSGSSVIKDATVLVMGSLGNIAAAYPYGNNPTTSILNNELITNTRRLMKSANSLFQKVIIRK
ncbi:phage tail protein [Pedobacter sp. Hv1]|uniref:phage tail protein n=1 Tax=Pedobacter sp. Hv1 TaxID=1740090 RepID=UPI0006D89816|nr:phage tail protein [Pedobacter sp. Hv1]KQC02100.1 hypothetical protein AQF98_00565 [Pedobacter sp. Hv1]